MKGSYYEYVLKVKSPLILAKHLHRKIYVSESDYISGSRVRGALLTFLYEQGYSNVKEEAYNPSIIFSPAYPVMKEEDKPVIGHAFSFKSKIDGDGKVFSSLGDVRALKKKFKEKPTSLFPSSSPSGKEKGVIKSVLGKPLFFDGKYWREIKIKMFEVESTAIDKRMGRAHTRMVFGFEAIPVGVIYKGYVYDSKNILDKELGLRNNRFDIFIGRGSSRGFGRCEIEFRRIDYSSRIDEIKKFIYENRFVVVMAFSPFTFPVGPLTYSVAPNELKSNNWISFDGRLTLYSYIDEIGRKFFASFGRQRSFMSYSLLANMRRPMINVSVQGSLYLYDVDGDIESISNALYYAEMKGFSNLASLGLGIIRVFDHDFLWGE